MMNLKISSFPQTKYIGTKKQTYIMNYNYRNHSIIVDFLDTIIGDLIRRTS